MNWPESLLLKKLEYPSLPPLEDQILMVNIEHPQPSYLEEFPWLYSRLKKSHTTPEKITTQLLLRQLIAHYIDDVPERVHFEYGTKGKPYIKGTPLYFNVSDTKDTFFIALSKTNPIGLDIEVKERLFNHVGISQRYLTKDEFAAFERVTEEEQRLWTLFAWTRKEALGKAMGVGIQYTVNQTETMRTFPQDTRVKYANKNYYLKSWQLPQYRLIGTVALEGEHREIQAIQIGAKHWQNMMR